MTTPNGAEPPVEPTTPPVAPQFGQPAVPPAPPYPQQYGQPVPQAPVVPQAPQAPQYGQPAVPSALPVYPGAAAGQARPEAAAAGTVERPKEIDIAFWVWIGSIALAVLSSVFMLVTGELIRMMDSAIEWSLSTVPDSNLTASDLAAMKDGMAGLAAAAIVIGIVFSLVWLIFVFAMRRGKNWGRIVLTVLGGMSVLSAVSSLSTIPMFGGFGAGMLLSLLASVGYVIAIVFMFRRPANEYFKAVKESAIV